MFDVRREYMTTTAPYVICSPRLGFPIDSSNRMIMYVMAGMTHLPRASIGGTLT